MNRRFFLGLLAATSLCSAAQAQTIVGQRPAIPVGNTINVMSYLTPTQQADVTSRGGATDETAAITSAIAALGITGGTLVFAPGKWNTTCGFTLTYPTLVTGSGQAAETTSFGSGTTITCSNGATTLFTVNSTYAMFQNIALVDTAVSRTAGSAIYVTSSYIGQRVDYEHIGVDGFYNSVDVGVGSSWVMHGNTIQNCLHWCVRVNNTVNPDAGDWTIDDNVFYPAGGALAAIQYEGSGGGKITNNKCVPNTAALVNCFYQDVTGHASIQTMIIHNDFEQVSGAAIKIVHGYRDTIIADNFLQTQSGSGPAMDLNDIDSLVVASNIFRGSGGQNALTLSNITHAIFAPNEFQGFTQLGTAGSFPVTSGVFSFNPTLVTSNLFEGVDAARPTIALQSVGSFWGQIGNTSSDLWFLGYGSQDTVNGTAVLSWSPTRVTLNTPIKRKGYTVSTLPTGSVGDAAYVTDAVVCTFLATLTGGGSAWCPVGFNGTAWVGE